MKKLVAFNPPIFLKIPSVIEFIIIGTSEHKGCADLLPIVSVSIQNKVTYRFLPTGFYIELNTKGVPIEISRL